MAATLKDLEGWKIIMRDENNNIIDENKRRSRRRNENITIDITRDSDGVSFTRGDSIITKDKNISADLGSYSVYYIHDIRLNTMTSVVELIAMTYLRWFEINPFNYYSYFEKSTFDNTKSIDYYKDRFNEEVDRNQLYLTAELKEISLKEFTQLANIRPVSDWKDELETKVINRDFSVRFLCDPDSTNFIEIDFEKLRNKMLTQEPKAAVQYFKKISIGGVDAVKGKQLATKSKADPVKEVSIREIKVESDSENNLSLSEEEEEDDGDDNDYHSDYEENKGAEDVEGIEDENTPSELSDSENDCANSDEKLISEEEYGESKKSTRTTKKRKISEVKEPKSSKKKIKATTPQYRTAKIKRFTKKNVDRARKKYTPFSKRFKNISDIPDLTKYADFNQSNLDLQMANYEAKLTAPTNSKVVETIFSKIKKQLYSSHGREKLIDNNDFDAYIPGRGKDFATIYLSLYTAIEAGTASTVYIAGTPGVGKTMTVREVIKELQSSMYQEELPEFQYVEINGLKMVKPTDSYEVLWNKISGERLTWGAAMESLEFYFNKVPKQKKRAVVVLLDELDALVTKAQDIMYNFFNWTTYSEAKLIVIAVANTMDLPERHLGNKVSSRIGFTRIMFTGYTHEELINIINSKLQGLNDTYFYVDSTNGNAVLMNSADAENGETLKMSSNIKKVKLRMSNDAIEITARKVASVSGDARRALKVCKRAAEIAEVAYMAKHGFKYDGSLVKADSDDDNDDNFADDKDVIALRKLKGVDNGVSNNEEEDDSVQTVHISHIMKALNEIVNTYNVEYIRKLPFSARLFLYAFLSLIRKTTFQEQEIGSIVDEIKLLADVNGNNKYISAVKNTLYQRENDRPDNNGDNSNSSTGQIRILSWNYIINNLIEAGVMSKQTMRHERLSTLKLNISIEDIKKALDFDETLKNL
ncbi:hypothetical protein TPHA_0B00480 [Tetrapisispora phaffii CBS 4417]|uniref:Origin recognition complex subunit 1 n=1 Tax=Tetrapisispora phaffii (strain ATCC 24235 / CBS 4417 / NBRC 1672 / NRRL Y-8282 / UCD 70-5) TaxID=1071381 RepID=G8BQC3_TETPH|nr:hypothetical protein TPHA_0B00480 [Tetrapisispora phaffii CBS 4417]CCE61720.1 hypothetical protein TPHA_0B00480 [Tetrapisispora phaffii CBS 4417]